MRKRYRTITLALASLLPLASSFAADTRLVKAVSDHFEVYTTDNEAAAKAALTHFEMVRAYLLKAIHSQDPFRNPVRIVGFKSLGEFSPYRPRNVESEKAFALSDAEHMTIVLAGLKKEFYEYGVREYVTELLGRAAPKMPYWLKLGFSELYCTLHMENGQLMLGSSPNRDFHSVTSPDLLNMSVMFSLNGGVTRDKGAIDFYAQTANTGGGQAPGTSSRSSAFGATDTMGAIESSQSVDYPAILWQLTHMMMFKKEYGSKFGAFVGAVSSGEDTVAAVERVFGQPLAGLKQDLVVYIKTPSHAVVGINFQLEKPVTPQVSQLSPGDSALILADLKAAR